MTTIAWDGTTLAADRCRVSNGLRQPITKLFVGERWVYAGCGDLAEVQEIWRWLYDRDGKWSDRPEVGEPGTHGLAVDRRGPILYVVDSVKRATLCPIAVDKPTASGGGRDFAIMALRLGKTAPEAVELAAEFDAFTGLGVDSWSRDGQYPVK